MGEYTTVEEPLEALADFGSDHDAKGEREAALREEEIAPTARCVYCGDSMVHGELPKFNRGIGIVIVVLGLLLSFFTLLLLGLPMVVIGVYMVTTARTVWTCPRCRAMVDRNAS